jgi:hypothetical protein
MKLCIVIVLSFALFDCGGGKSDDDQWKEFKQKFNKIYKNADEEAKKFEKFKENLEKFRIHNENANATFKMGVNRNADYTFREIELNGQIRKT